MSGEVMLGPAALQLKEESWSSVRWALGGGPVPGDTALREGAPWEGPVCSGKEIEMRMAGCFHVRGSDGD